MQVIITKCVACLESLSYIFLSLVSFCDLILYEQFVSLAFWYGLIDLWHG